jgi:hypothetical protein
MAHVVSLGAKQHSQVYILSSNTEIDQGNYKISLRS